MYLLLVLYMSNRIILASYAKMPTTFLKLEVVGVVYNPSE